MSAFEEDIIFFEWPAIYHFTELEYRLEEKHLSSIFPMTDAPTIRGTLVLDS